MKQDDLINDLLNEKRTPSKDSIRIQLVNQSFIQGVRNSRDFRRFVWHILSETGFTGQPFTGHRDATDFNCGKRDVGIMIFTMIDQFCPDHFSIMMKEAREDSAYDHGTNSSSVNSNDGSSNSNSGGSHNTSGNPDGGDDSIAIIGKPGSSI